MKRLRKLLWPEMKKEFIRRIGSMDILISYPLLIYISLQDTCKNIYIEKGRKALVDHLKDKIGEITNNLFTIAKPKKNSIQENIEWMREYKRQEDEEEKKQQKSMNSFIDKFYKDELN